MLALPPPPPSPVPPSPLPQPPPQQHTRRLPRSTRPTTPISSRQIIISKFAANREAPAPDEENLVSSKPTKQTILRQPQRTNPLIWCCAIACLIFSLILIFFGIATLILFLVIKPKTPSFDIPNASLNTIYFDSPEYFNGDFTFLANFSNPNRKIDIRFEYLDMELYFSDRLIATQSLAPFTQRPGKGRLGSVRLISSLVYLPVNHAVALRTQVQNNHVNYNMRGTFKVRASLESQPEMELRQELENPSTDLKRPDVQYDCVIDNQRCYVMDSWWLESSQQMKTSTTSILCTKISTG